MSLALGIDPVLAQTETPTNTPVPTSTPTFRPLFSTPTPVSYNFECPGYQPIGWGSVTPAAWWLMNCSQCVTPVSNWDWGDNPLEVTPTAETTPGVTPTATPEFKEMEVLFSWPNTTYQDEYIPANFLHLTNQLNVHYSNLQTANYYMRESSLEAPYINSNVYGQYYGVFYLVGRGSAYNSYNSGVKVTGECRAIDGCLLNFENVEYPLDYSEKFTFYEGVVNVGAGGNLVTGEINFYVDIYKDSVSTLKQGFTLRVEKLAAYMFSDSSWYNDFIWDYDEIGNGYEPTPEGGYCSIVQDENNQQTPDDPGFSIPEFTIGYGSCIGVGDINIPMAWLKVVFPNAEDIYIPGIQACFVPINFGHLAMFGLSINLDLIALVLAAVVLIRLITRS